MLRIGLTSVVGSPGRMTSSSISNVSAGLHARRATQRMVDSLRKEHNAADRPQNQCPWGCAEILPSLCRAPWHRSPGYDLRRTTCDHHDFGSNAAYGGLVQCFPDSLLKFVASDGQVRRKAAKRVRQGWAACRCRPTRKNRNVCGYT